MLECFASSSHTRQPGGHASLRRQLHPAIQEATALIEDAWLKSLRVSPYPLAEEFGYVEGTVEGEKLIIANICYESEKFRKLHIELARSSGGLNVFHCVMFPRPEFDLPSLGVDMVGTTAGRISAAVLDLSPTRPDGRLPGAYETRLRALPPVAFTEPRALPDWADIFSSHCMFVRLQDPAEDQQFLDRLRQWLTIHLEQAHRTERLTSPESIRQRVTAQVRYCDQQQRNDKTRRVLEKSFGKRWTERYMRQVLFDAPVTQDAD